MNRTVVIPTIGRESLRATLRALLDASAADPGSAPREIIVVDDRPGPGAPLPLPAETAPVPDGGTTARVPRDGPEIRVIRSGGRGPAAARNAGWRAATTEWVAFLDDDVVPAPGWPAALAADLGGLPPGVGGSQGRVTVPPPDGGRAPTDWERGTAALAGADWITADMAYRRGVLEEVGGFDERFRRAYREDADLALRVLDAGHGLVLGARRVTHPVRPAGFWASVRAQAGNADDVLMWRVHGRCWRARAGEGRGLLRRHVTTTAAGLLSVATAPAARHGRPTVHLAAVAAWAVLTARFAHRRIRPGPRTPDEILKMTVTSAAIPPVAVWHRLRGLVVHRRAGRWDGPWAVLFDRDDTLIKDVPYNGDPARVEPMPGARRALDRLRRHGARIGVVSNQSGVAKGHITADDVRRVNARVEELLGRVDVWEFCPHDGDDACDCRKPRPGMIVRAARRLGVPPSGCAVIGDIGRDVEAAAAAGARGILVPTRRTLAAEIARAPETAPTLLAAVDLVLGGRRRR
ncbi:HAD-IIIA family hydrolase [Actinomadura spongiicola]|uniref:D,D-heptose 1,7-bisphosphate phosphatase n=1 Tax=Actinomadura spongiicola TaxID=2303421 RepID=A0A372GAG7_9ACTN|nr:HAD-IIIA family hydrolase [Actinomadura spongiicola]RFS82398.1 HAD-IIIA family hydrolase [Actinomadura spongiicola]